MFIKKWLKKNKQHHFFPSGSSVCFHLLLCLASLPLLLCEAASEMKVKLKSRFLASIKM